MSSEDESVYSIGEASDNTGLPESTIRFYDREFSEYLSIDRGDNNQRIFTDENLKDLEYIRYLIKREDMSVEEVGERLNREQDLQKRRSQADDVQTEEQSNGTSGKLDDSVKQLKNEINELRNVINQQQNTIEHLKENQEDILKLLDMNLKRYNQLVDNLPS